MAETKTTEPRGPLEDTLLRSVPIPATTTDAVGVERIVEPTPADWEPAPVEPHPDDVARAEKFQGILAEQREKRLSQFTAGDVGESAGKAKQALENERGGQPKPSGDEKAKTGGRSPEGRTAPKGAE